MGFDVLCPGWILEVDVAEEAAMAMVASLAPSHPLYGRYECACLQIS